MQAEMEEAYPILSETDIDPYDTLIAGFFIFMQKLPAEEREEIRKGVNKGIEAFISTLERNNIDFIHTLSPERVYVTDPRAIIKKDNSVYKLFREEMDSIKKEDENTENSPNKADIEKEETVIPTTSSLGAIGISTKELKNSNSDDESDDEEDDDVEGGAGGVSLDIEPIVDGGEEALVNSVFGDLMPANVLEIGENVLGIEVDNESPTKEAAEKIVEDEDDDDIPMMGEGDIIHINTIGKGSK